MPSMRVAMLSVHTCPLAALGGKKTGGMNVYVRELSMEIGRRGISVDIFTRAHGDCVAHAHETEIGPGVRVIHVPAGPEIPLRTVDIYRHLPQFVENILDFVEHEGRHYDLIHSHYWLSGWVAERLRENWGVPIIQMFHTLGLMKNRIALSPNEHEPPIRIETERQVMQAADYLIAATPAERIQLMYLYGASMPKIHCVSPGVDITHFRPVPKAEALAYAGIDPNRRMILFVGRIEPLKGIDTLLQSLVLIRERAPELGEQLSLAIIGGDPVDAEDPEMVRLLQLSEELDLRDPVLFLGSREQDVLQYYYSAAEAVIMPSHYEFFGMVALEAMACGTPVVASEVGGLAYLVRDGVTGFHVPDRSPEDLASRIQLLLENDELRHEMSISSMQLAERYAWPLIASQIVNIYEESVHVRADQVRR